jgi:hypothetical protein
MVHRGGAALGKTGYDTRPDEGFYRSGKLSLHTADGPSGLKDDGAQAACFSQDQSCSAARRRPYSRRSAASERGWGGF